MPGHNNGYLADKWLVWNIDGGTIPGIMITRTICSVMVRAGKQP